MASALTYLFSQIPLAPECPSCGKALALRPWEFQSLRFAASGSSLYVLSPCGLCGDEVTAEVSAARAPLRLALSMVTRPSDLQGSAVEAARELDRVGGGGGFLQMVSTSAVNLGEMDPATRAGLIISLDEMAETEALESEWREAEELASIMDGELTQVPGFERFRRRILRGDG
jgi:hypothetical protein